jgi:hypothetical protein
LTVSRLREIEQCNFDGLEVLEWMLGHETMKDTAE